MKQAGPRRHPVADPVDCVLPFGGRRRPILPVPFGLAKVQARMLELADMLTLGLMPDSLKLTRDQVLLLQKDNVVSPEAIAEGRTLAAFGIVPRAPEAIAPDYLVRFRKTGQFD